jgi:hypothetical protein
MMRMGSDDGKAQGTSQERAFDLLDQMIDAPPSGPQRGEAEVRLRDTGEGAQLAEVQAAFDAHPAADSSPDLRAAVMARLSPTHEPTPTMAAHGAAARFREWLGLGGSPAHGHAPARPRMAAVAAAALVFVIAFVAAGWLATNEGLAGAALLRGPIDPRLLVVAAGSILAFVAYLRSRGH